MSKENVISVLELKDKIKCLEKENELLKKEISRLKSYKVQAEYDGLTNLYNKTTFISKVSKLDDNDNVIVMLDIDDFKKINDTLGHNYGDKILIMVGNILKDFFRHSDIISRFGGDEFLVLLKDININDSEKLLNNLKEKINMHYINEDIGNLGVSIGACNYNLNLSYEDNLEKVDEALYKSKNNGKNQITIEKTR